MKYATLMTLSLLASSAGLTAQAPGLEAGLAAYGRGDYVTAVRQLIPVANAGDPRAQLTVAEMFALGRGVPKNGDQALSWYRRAAERAPGEALLQMGRLHRDGGAVTKSPRTAIPLFFDAVAHGEFRAAVDLADLFGRGEHVDQNLPEATAWLDYAAEQGHAPSRAHAATVRARLSDKQRQSAGQILTSIHKELAKRRQKLGIQATPAPAPQPGQVPQRQGPPGPAPRPGPDRPAPQPTRDDGVRQAQVPTRPWDSTPAPPQPQPQPHQATPPAPRPTQPTLSLPLNPLVAAMPDIASVPQPSWLKVGTRMTFLSGSSTSYDQTGSRLVNDPNGQWTDENGNRFSESAGLSGSGGMGITQIDVVGISDGAIALEMRTILWIDGTPNRTKLGGVQGMLVHPSGCDYWINPALLRRWVNQSGNGVTVQRMTLAINGETHRTFYVRTQLRGGYVTYAYDEDTGVLLSHSSKITSSAGQVITRDGNRGTTTNANATSLGITRYRGVRQVSLPWSGSTLPAFIAESPSLAFQGSMTNFMPGSPPISIPVQGGLQRTRRGSAWIECAEQTNHTTPGFPTRRIFAAHQVGALWIPPQVLSSLRPGQVLDRDPVSGVELSVQQGPGGHVVIGERGGEGARLYTYDATSGRLVTITLRDEFPETRSLMVTETHFQAR